MAVMDNNPDVSAAGSEPDYSGISVVLSSKAPANAFAQLKVTSSVPTALRWVGDPTPLRNTEGEAGNSSRLAGLRGCNGAVGAFLDVEIQDVDRARTARCPCLRTCTRASVPAAMHGGSASGSALGRLERGRRVAPAYVVWGGAAQSEYVVWAQAQAQAQASGEVQGPGGRSQPA
ncbi:hypothetical protein [Kribbella catacumbae]|uniref:hypothetical protein n=1 Tax=Kribbella catacumbae TaxID=460086 RepID=UPI0012FB383A|nr:hypothetical protein [Kribbella catacumbae]